MEGRRVNREQKARTAQKRNPLYVLFLCLVSAVFVLLVLSIVLVARLRNARSQLTRTLTQLEELEKSLDDAEEEEGDDYVVPLPAGLPSTTPDRDSLTGGNEGDDEGGDDGGGTSSSWLDLSGHNEVTVAPKTLLDSYQTYYTTTGINLRSGPGTEYNRIAGVSRGTKVDVAAKEGNWMFARVGSNFGWMSADYLSTTAPAPEATSGSISR